MTKYSSDLNGFNNKCSIYKRDVSDNGKIRIHGIYYINGILMKFYLNSQTTGALFLFRGQISIISPANGQILQSKGINRKNKIDDLKKKNSKVLERLGQYEGFNAMSELYVNTSKDDEIKAHIDRSALSLFAKFEPTIHIVQKEMGVVAKYTATAAATLYLEEFLSKEYGKYSYKTISSKRCSIRRVAAFVSSVSMGSETQALLKAYARKHSRSAIQDLRTAKCFWDFCRKKHVYDVENPLDMYFENTVTYKRTVDPKEAIRKSSELTCLPTEIERNLKQNITSNISNGENMGLLLVNECGLPSKIACKHIWKEVIYNSAVDYVAITIQKDDTASATHDYTRPLTPFAADVLTKRYRLLQNLYTDEQLREMPIVSTKNNPEKPLDHKVLTNLCRTALIQAGIDQNNLITVSSKVYGAGIRLLLRNIKYRLEHHCGLSTDPAAVRFLLQKTMNDTTAESYRSFTCPEGQTYLYNALKRDTRFIEKPESATDEEFIKEITPDGKIEYTIMPEAPDKLTSFKAKLLVKPGGRVEITGLQEVTCSTKKVVEKNKHTRITIEPD
ncbi:MAG: hypothetical protein GX796_10270 [Clostridiaceae bacterium]|nr:hypothetical protein [Clostridiaceae bacterium]